VQAKLYQEIESASSQNPNSALIELLPKLVYFKNVIYETLRLRPPTPITTRVVGEDCEFGGKKIPKGSELFLFFHNVHLSSKHWDKPLEFFPERFEKSEIDRHPYAYLPFLAGERNCIGQKLAMEEALIYLFHLVRNFRVVCQEINRVSPTFQATYSPTSFESVFFPR
jgi:cytochrome P450